ncbi:MAG: type II secretion system F family protein [Syntrophobacteraceae bacterium]
MAYYQYQARDLQGQTQRGVLEALSEIDAARKLKSSRLFPLKIKAVKSQRPRRVPEDHIFRFFYDLSDLLSAGLPVDRALALISTNQTHKVFQQVVQDLLEEVQGGNDLSGALGKYRDIFGDLSGHMVRAGEAGGALGPIIKRLAQYIEQRKAFKQSLISSMIYPLILFVTSGLSIVILLVYVIPKFAQIFHDLNQKVPTLTHMLLQAGVFLKNYGWVFPLLLIVGFWGGKYLYRQTQVRRSVDRLLFKIPFTRYFIVNSELSRFCRTLGTMLHAGVPLLRALSLGEEVLINTVLKEAISPLHGEIKAGHSMSNFFRSQEKFPSRVGTMLRISEEQGNLGEGLIALGDYFEKELQRSVQRIMALLEPVVIVATGAVIGTMVLSMFTAIFGINEIKF